MDVVTLRPIFPVERAKLNGFCDMRRKDELASCKVRDRAGDAQDPVVSAGGKPES